MPPLTEENLKEKQTFGLKLSVKEQKARSVETKNPKSKKKIERNRIKGDNLFIQGEEIGSVKEFNLISKKYKKQKIARGPDYI